MLLGTRLEAKNCIIEHCPLFFSNTSILRQACYIRFHSTCMYMEPCYVVHCVLYGCFCRIWGPRNEVANNGPFNTPDEV
jgi:hypothetical protein